MDQCSVRRVRLCSNPRIHAVLFSFSEFLFGWSIFGVALALGPLESLGPLEVGVRDLLNSGPREEPFGCAAACIGFELSLNPTTTAEHVLQPEYATAKAPSPIILQIFTLVPL